VSNRASSGGGWLRIVVIFPAWPIDRSFGQAEFKVGVASRLSCVPFMTWHKAKNAPARSRLVFRWRRVGDLFVRLARHGAISPRAGFPDAVGRLEHTLDKHPTYGPLA
jgi:hypothetical protein